MLMVTGDTMIGTRHAKEDETGLRELNEENKESVIGKIVKVSHPVVGRKDQLARISGVVSHDERQVVRAIDVLTGQKYTWDVDSLYTGMSYPSVGSTYRVFKLQHLNGRGDWVDTTPWVSHQYAAQGYYVTSEGHEGADEYNTHEPQRVFFKQANYVGSDSTGNRAEQVTFKEGTLSVKQSAAYKRIDDS